ncbi:hypothetical protein Taro_021782 [Colocasia esculenta]|uniref:Uncharacterized protein n=1 Tax=Colocasia esculenta TaxID=4460 RepID=A0A843VCJ8_COLES|nr:hypothetical protein [Colocasia esculenta]
MDVGRTFHMNGGLGDTSYAKNSSLQRGNREMVRHVILEAMVDVYTSLSPPCLKIADLGCASGPNAFSLAEDIVGAVKEVCQKMTRPVPEFLVLLNDLPSNDFNSIFVGLPDFIDRIVGGRLVDGSSFFLMGVPGSFYGRLFPSNSLHFIHSAHSLHWLSQVPSSLFDEDGKSINKGKLYLSATSPPLVQKAYLMQFQNDFSLFLKSRSKELVAGGKMVLITMGRRSRDHSDSSATLLWDLLAEAFATMVSKGEIEEEKFDLYNAHFYAPCVEEIEAEVKREGSFTFEHLGAFEGRTFKENAEDAGIITMTIRAIQEPLLRHLFTEAVVDMFFQTFHQLVERELAQREHKAISILLVLRKL